MSNQLESVLESALDKIKGMADADSVIGSPITTPDGTTVIPISKVSYGFGSGGSDLPTKNAKDLFGGGVGGGVTITPVAFISIYEGKMQVVQIEPFTSAVDRIIEKAPIVLDKFGDFLDNKKAERKAKKEAGDIQEND